MLRESILLSFSLEGKKKGWKGKYKNFILFKIGLELLL